MCSIWKSLQTSLTQLPSSSLPPRSHPPGSLQLNSLSFSQRFGESGTVSAPITHVWALIYPLPAWGCCAPASQNAKWVVAAALSPALAPEAGGRDPQPCWGCSGTASWASSPAPCVPALELAGAVRRWLPCFNFLGVGRKGGRLGPTA